MYKFTESDCLWYKKEAAFFEEALPLGNGTLGAMIWGGAKNARFSLNHDTFWTGCPSDGLNDIKKEAYFEAQRLALLGKYDEAQAVLEKDFCQGARHAAYQPLGDLYIKSEAEEISDYKRALFLREGLACEEFFADGVKVFRESFVSNPDKCMCVWIHSDAPKNFTISLGSLLENKLVELESGIELLCEAPLDAPFQIYKNACDKSVRGKRGMRASLKASVAADGETRVCDSKIFVNAAKDVFVYVSAETSFAGFDKDLETEGRNERMLSKKILDAALIKGYNAIKKEHVEDVTKYYDRVKLFLGEDGCADIPTDERIKRNAAGKGDSDRALYTLKFNYGRYLTIAASREGSQAMNLQGIWCDSLDPAWSSNYTTNINLQMNYFPTLGINLVEMTEPLDRLIENISKHGRKTAEKIYGARGFVCHHNSDVWAHTVPIEGEALYSFWPFGSGWLCHHLLDKYDYTLDTKYLGRVYPILREASRFYLDILVDVDGYRAFCPATSPENYFIFNGKRVSTAKSTTMSIQIARELFEGTVRAAGILGIEDDVTEEIKKELPRLMPTRFLSDGRIEEWYFGDGIEYPENETDHLHISHLYALYPAYDINETTPELMACARKTREKREAPSTGWSMMWKADCYARLGDGDSALRLLDKGLEFVEPDPKRRYGRTGGTYPNLFDVHPPFQIDGNFGYTSAVCEMLVQSDGEKIKPLPALPSKWKNGEVHGLRVKGNKTVDISWKDGKIIEFKVNNL